MGEMSIKDLMVPLAEYATVSKDATLFEAVQALRESQRKFDRNKDMHRAILVLDEHQHAVGKLSQLDVIKGLEPKYNDIENIRGTSQLGFTRSFIRSVIKSHGLWEYPLGDLCKKAAQTRVKDIMYTPAEGEYVMEEASLDEAIHQLIVGRHQSLLVLREKEIVGILRMSDIYRVICNMIMACNVNVNDHP